MSLVVKNYTLSHLDYQKNQKRITNSIKKIPCIKEVYINKEKNNLLLEIDTTDESDKYFNKLEEEILNKIREYDKKAEIQRVIVKEVYRKVLYLNGLDCSHCAARIESIAKKELTYEKILVDFSTFRFIIETHDKTIYDNLIELVTQITNKVDERIVVTDSLKKNNKEVYLQTSITKTRFIIFLSGILVALLGLFWSANFDFQELIGFFAHENLIDVDIIPLLLMITGYILIGYKVILRFFKNTFKGHLFDENFLMTVASFGAMLTGHYFEAMMVLALFQIGEYLQEKAVNHSRKSINELLKIDCQKARLKMGSEITEIEVESIFPGDTIIVNKGEMIPLDGVVLHGKTNLDTKNITGEARLFSVNEGDEVMAGSINMANVLEIKVLRPYSESLITKIIDMVENANTKKAHSENFITKFSKYYTPVVIGIAAFIAILGFSLVYFPSLAYDDPDLSGALRYVYKAMVFLVISCPCALVISIPLCFFGGIGLASKRGILIKGSNYLEALNNVKTFVFDKTGTLTEGEFNVIHVETVNDLVSQDQLVRLLMHTEYYSTHPIAVSIVDKYGKDLIIPDIIEDFMDIPSRGAKALVNGRKIVVGNDKLMEELKIDYYKTEEIGVIIHIVRDSKYLGFVVIGDSVRSAAASTVVNLKKQGINNFYILTGDSNDITENVANRLGIDSYYSGLLPDQKVEKMQEIIKTAKKGEKTVFVGDGINDAPVISTADIGIAMGASGSDATIAISDVVIMNDNLEKLDELICIAKATRRKVIQNIIFCLGIKLIVIILGLIPNMTLPLGVAIFSDVGVSLIAILNSLLIMRLFKKKNKEKNYE